MQVEMANGSNLEDVAEAASDETNLEGITSFQYGCAVLDAPRDLASSCERT